jgi:ClpP class serine protease
MRTLAIQSVPPPPGERPPPADPVEAYRALALGYARAAAGSDAMLGPCGYLASGIAVVVVRGPLGEDLPWWLGVGTPYPWIAESVDRAAEAVLAGHASSVLIDLDSPGGATDGVESAADAVERAAARVRVAAMTDGLAASAGYWLIAGAGEIILSPTAQAGSIGAITEIYDGSQDEWARRYGVVKSADLKLGPHEPIGEDYFAMVREHIDELHRLFRGRVARGRGIAEAAIDAMRGRMYTGRAAVDAGLADRVALPREVYQQLTGAPS